MSETLRVRAPGRICLVGEHQDYFGLAAITVAFNRYVTFTARPNDEKAFLLDLPDVGKKLTLPLEGEVPYEEERDYLRAGRNLLWRQGARWSRGWSIDLRSDVPMGKGVSSSSALCVAWVKLLAERAEPKVVLTPEETAELAYRSEVAEFNEPGGQMDHYATALGGLLHLDFAEATPKATRLTNFDLQGVILGDSLKTKDTTGMIASIKEDVLAAVEEVKAKLPEFSLPSTSMKAYREAIGSPLTPRQRRLLTTLESRDLTASARGMMESGDRDSLQKVAFILNRHHEGLALGLGNSTPEIDELRQVSISAGAWGGKIVGSGGGGCFVILAPFVEDSVRDAIVRTGGEAHQVSLAGGVEVLSGEPETVPPTDEPKE